MKEINVRKIGSLTRKILRALGINRDFARSSNAQGEDQSVHVDISAYYGDNWAMTALLEAERKKTEALIERQRRNFLY